VIGARRVIGLGTWVEADPAEQLADGLTDFKRYAITKLDILPRPAGVRIRFVVAASAAPFGFYGVPGAHGFNSGKFAGFL